MEFLKGRSLQSHGSWKDLNGEIVEEQEEGMDQQNNQRAHIKEKAGMGSR